ncbi:MAG: L,D-transpeptidase [FCB group bacterium]|nr:L,D-transpeptidase [FCB group bacterium]
MLIKKSQSIIYRLLLISLCLFSGACKAENKSGTTENSAIRDAGPDIGYLLRHYNEIVNVTNVTNPETAILIDGKDHRLYLVRAQEEGLEILASYLISASKYGYGSARGSNQTPWGVHRIAGKYGESQPSGMSFYDRRPTGKIAEIYTDTTDVDEDPVTSRILWLEGLEDINRTSYWRFIYIHGTHEEGLLGTPQSKGCIRMANKDIIELFDLVAAGTYVNIIRPLSDTETEDK